MFAELAAMKLLIDLLNQGISSKKAVLIENSLLALSQLTSSNSNRLQLEDKSLQLLAKFIQDDRQEIQRNAISVVVNCMENSQISFFVYFLIFTGDLRQKMSSLGAIEQLISVLPKSADRITQEKILAAIALCVNGASTRSIVEKFNGIDMACNLLSSEHEQVVRNALWTLILCLHTGPSLCLSLSEYQKGPCRVQVLH